MKFYQKAINRGWRKVFKMAKNGSKWCFWSKWRKRPKKAKNGEKRLNFGQKYDF